MSIINSDASSSVNLYRKKTKKFKKRVENAGAICYNV